MLKQKVSYISEYKNIPSDWIISPLGEVVEVVSGGTPSTKKEEYWNGEVLWATPTDISKSSKYITETERKISSRGLEKSSAILLPPQSVLVTSRATIGLHAINPYPMATNQGFKSLVPKSNVDHEFLYYLVFLLRKEMIRRASGSTFLEISKKDVENINILLPPLEEQQKIASILSTWDEAIESYQLLLEEKSKIQRGFVQKILHENIQKWPKKKVGQIFDNITRGYVLSRKKVLEEPKDDYIYPVYSSQTLDDGLLGYYNDYLFENALTWTTDGANAGTVNYREKKFYCTNVCGVLISEKGYSNKLMASILNSVTHRYVSYVGNPKLMNNVMQDIVIPLPPLEIQEEVSNILNLMDREIELLEKLIVKLKEQKRGLMQLLLTGKVRV